MGICFIEGIHNPERGPIGHGSRLGKEHRSATGRNGKIRRLAAILWALGEALAWRREDSRECGNGSILGPAPPETRRGGFTNVFE
jgi:hypothetical protein